MHLGYGLAAILAFIGVKLVLHWAHGIWPAVPTVATEASLVVIVAILATVVLTSVLANRRTARREATDVGVEARPDSAKLQDPDGGQ